MDSTSADGELKFHLRAARYAALTSRARTLESNALVDHLLPLVTTDAPTSKRGAYATTRKQRRLAVEGFVGDLLRAQNHEKAVGWVYRPLGAKSFTGEVIGHRAFKVVRDRLVSLGLVEHKGPVQSLSEGFDPSGPKMAYLRHASRFKGTEALLVLSARYGVPVEKASAHFLTELPKKPLRLRTCSARFEGNKIRGRPMPFDVSPITEELESQVRSLNEFLDQFDLRGGTHRGYVRIFNRGDDPAFDWNMGGRLYSVGDDNYQQLPEDDRVRMTIDSEPLCEIDIRASYLTILHALHIEPFDASKDPYALPGFGADARKIIKAWFTATFGNGSHLTRWPSEIVRAYYRERTGQKLGKDYPVKAIKKAAIKAFPIMERWGEGEDTWATLMYLESKAMMTTMLDLMSEHSIPSLSIHDSLLVPASKQSIAEELLRRRYFEVTGAIPTLTITPPTPVT
jgi:hypothetical protein